MLHIIRLIERRRGDSGASHPLRTPLFVLAVLAVGAGLALASHTHAQEPPTPTTDTAASEAASAATTATEATAPDTMAQTSPPAETTSEQAAASDATQDSEGASAVDLDPTKEAFAVLDAMDAGDFAGVHARFDATMSAAVAVDQLRQIWTTLPNQIGAAQGRGEATLETRDGVRIARIPLRYERAELMAIVGFDTNGKVTGFAIRPMQANAAAPVAYVAPPLPTNATFTEREMVVGDTAKGLGATLALPNGKGPFPAVVLVHGSGPQDRDETLGPNKPFLDIARGLAERGVAVLRYDKRTLARPQDYADVAIDIDRETTDDAVLAIAALRAETKIDAKRIFVLGHSQGGMMAPRIALRSAQADAPVAGVVLFAAPSRALLDILIEQTRRMAVLDDGKTSPEESAAIADIGRRVAAVRRSGEVANNDSPGGLPAAYWRSVDAVDPIADARALTQRMLILQGATDIQVVDADWQGWKGAFHSTPRVTFKLYETLNHLGMPGEGSIAEYQTPGHVDSTLIADIAAWIGQTKPQKKK